MLIPACWLIAGSNAVCYRCDVQQGKEAILAILGTDDFFGEGCPVPAVPQIMMRIDDRQPRFEDPLLLLFCERPRCETRRGPPTPTSGAGNRALPVRFRHSCAARGQSKLVG